MDTKLFRLILPAMFGLAFATAMTGGTVAQTSCVHPPIGLISWWPGDGNADDLVDRNSGTLQNGATFASGFVTSGNDQAFSFDGTGSYVLVPHNANLNVQSHSIEAWIRTPDFTPPISFLTILSKTTPAPFKISFGLFVRGFHPKPEDFPPGSLVGALTQPENNILESNGAANVTDGHFHHVAVTYDAPTGVLRVYVDGKLDGQTELDPGTLPNTHNLPASIGADLSVDGGNPDTFFNGLIDELALYKRALSALEIKAIFDAGSAGKCKLPSAFLCYDIKVAKGEPRSERREVLVFNQIEQAVGGRVFILKKPKLLCVRSEFEDLGGAGNGRRKKDDD